MRDVEWLAGKLADKRIAWAVVAVVVALGVAGLVGVSQVEHEDDLLAFLPQDNPDVEAFGEVNRTFGSLDLALVGIETDDVFAPDFLRRLREVTSNLNDLPGLDHVMSLANVVDFTPDQEHGGIVTELLVQEIPAGPRQRRALRDKVLSRGHVVGNLVSADGRGVLMYCYLGYGTDARTMADTIREKVKAAFAGETVYWGGGPFISTYIYNATRQDIHNLTPWAVLAIVIILMLSFRDFFGVCLVLLSTGLGILVSLGIMSLFGVRFNIVLGSMPVILFAIGSAYGIHVLSRYYKLAAHNDCRAALAGTLKEVGPTVLAAGLTTAAGLLSFVMMDIRPLRTFGLYTALGILATLVLSLTFVPAVARVSKLRRKRAVSRTLRRWMVRLTVFARRRRAAVGAVLVVVAIVGGGLVTRVNTSLDTTTFFAEGSPPDLADRFMAAHFGGSQFIQIHVEGDMNDPAVLRELQRLADRIRLLPHVTSVQHIGEMVALMNDALAGQRRIPDTEPQVRLQYSFLLHDPSLQQLVTRDRDQALMHIKVDSSRAEVLQRVLDRVEGLVAEKAVTSYRIEEAAGDRPDVRERKLDMVGARIAALAARYGLATDPDFGEKLRAELEDEARTADHAAVARRLARFLASDECAVDLAAEELPAPDELAAALVELGPAPGAQELAARIARASGREVSELLVEDLVFSVAAPLDQFWSEERAARRARALVEAMDLGTGDPGRDARFTRAVAMALLDLEAPTVMLKDPGGAGGSRLSYRVTGQPVMYRGLSVSATRNQLHSLAFALVLVVIIMAVMFRSIPAGMLVAAPIVLTLLVIYGGMGLLEVNLDIGTAMLASLILGAGVDYAVHLTSAWRARDHEPVEAAAARAADATGPAIWTNAIMVCAGFFVLTLGEARPLKNVGGLTATAMLVAALTTFLAIPVLARKRRYRKSNHDDGAGELDRSRVVQDVLDEHNLPRKAA